MKKNSKSLWIMLPGLLLAIFLASCNIGNKSLVEQWKAEVAPDVGEKMETEVEKRFNRIVSSPNEYQRAYLKLAKTIVGSMSFGQATHEDGDELEKYIKEQVERMLGGYYSNFDSEVVANYQSHPEIYVENVRKLIEPVDELWDIARSYVTVKESKKFKTAGYDNWLVLYQVKSVNGGKSRYYVCKIVDVGQDNDYQESEISGNDFSNFTEALEEYSALVRANN